MPYIASCLERLFSDKAASSAATAAAVADDDVISCLLKWRIGIYTTAECAAFKHSSMCSSVFGGVFLSAWASTRSKFSSFLLFLSLLPSSSALKKEMSSLPSFPHHSPLVSRVHTLEVFFFVNGLVIIQRDAMAVRGEP